MATSLDLILWLEETFRDLDAGYITVSEAESRIVVAERILHEKWAELEASILIRRVSKSSR